MSSTALRRMRRKMKKDVIKNIQGEERNLKIPTEKDIQEYIDNMIKEINIDPNVQLQERTEDSNTLSSGNSTSN
jgi:hypothetical protein